MNLTKGDLKDISTVVENVVEQKIEPIHKDLGEVKNSVQSLTTSVDGFTHIVRRHEQEWLVLRAQHDKIRNVLVKKKIATEDELAIS